MKKLNNKGYMLIEIIIASAITFTIAFSLISLIIKFKDRNEDVYSETVILNDKINITKNIMDDLSEYTIVGIDNTENKNIINLEVAKENEKLKKRLIISGKTIEYGTIDETTNEFLKNNRSYFKKTISNHIDVGEPNIETSNNTESNEQIMTLIIPISSIYSDKKNEINIFFKTKNLFKISYEDNLFISNYNTTPTKKDGIDFQYDEQSQILTLNGTSNTNSYLLGSLTNMTLKKDEENEANSDKYNIKLTHLTGDYNSSVKNIFYFDFIKATETEKKINQNISLNLPKKGEENRTITYNTDANEIQYRIFPNRSIVTFNDYKMRILVTKPHSKLSKYGEKYGQEPIPSKGSNYIFDGWYKDLEGNEKITADTEMTRTENHTIYAHWIKKPDEPKGLNVYVISLNAGNDIKKYGTTEIYEKNYLDENNETKGAWYKSAKLTDADWLKKDANPIDIPEREGYTFGGYFTEEDGEGTQIITGSKEDEPGPGYIKSGTYTTFSSDGTLYAHWIKN